MNTHDQKKIRTLLENQRDQILDEIKLHGATRDQSITREIRDPEDQAAAIADLWVDDKIMMNDGHFLEKIDSALKRLDEGTYHLCADCNGKIPTARLLARPSASLCISCQEKKDAGVSS